MQQLQSRKAWGVTRAELERQLQQQRRSAEADKAASLQSLKDLFQRCSSASPEDSPHLGLLPFDMLARRARNPAARSALCERRVSACMRAVLLCWRLVIQCQVSEHLPRAGCQPVPRWRTAAASNTCGACTRGAGICCGSIC